MKKKKQGPLQGNKIVTNSNYVVLFHLFLSPVAPAAIVFALTCNLSQGEQTTTIGGALNDSLNHSCENRTFPVREAVQVRRPDNTTLLRDRGDQRSHSSSPGLPLRPGNKTRPSGVHFFMPLKHEASIFLNDDQMMQERFWLSV